MARARLNGIEIDYEVTGNGPTLLLSHGYGSTRHMWDGQHQAFPGWRVVSWDMRGHGQTDSPADPKAYSSALTMADMRALLEHVGVERAVIGGLSLGGYVSLAFALAHPAMTRALVICDSGPGYRNAEARAGWNRSAFERAAGLEAKGLDALARRSRETQRAVHRSAQGLAHAARGMLAQESSQVIDGLAGLRMPTLIIVGDQDQPFVVPSEYMAKKIPGARLAVIPGAGHSSNLDQPEIFNRVLGEFLAGL